MAPLFSYRFKNYLNERSTPGECRQFIHEVYHCLNDEFMEQLKMKESGHYPTFEDKNGKPSHLALKHTRYHNLTPMLLENIPGIKLIHIVRNPCASIYSWISTAREFPENDDPLEFWRNGKNRKTSEEEFWGFDDWVKLTRYYLELQKEHPEQVLVVSYETLVNEPVSKTKEMFSFCNMNSLPSQTEKFLQDSLNSSSDNKYSVFRGQNEVLDKWKAKLPETIKDEIYTELKHTPLEVYLK